MQTNKDIPYYLTAAGLFILLKFAFTQADLSDINFLLKPTNHLVGLLTGSSAVYTSDTGYYHEQLHIIIDKSCSGFNFWVLGFLLFTYVIVKHSDKTLSKILAMPVALAVAYLLTIFVNTSRIFASIVVQTFTDTAFPNHQHLIHETIGIITNLTFLVLAYVLIEKLLIHKRYHAKFT